MKTLETKRKEFNYSYKNMADMLKISKTYYWQLENKKKKKTYVL